MNPAIYFDGRSARAHPIQLEVATGSVSLYGIELARSYPFSETRLAEPFPGAPAMLYFADGAHCEVDGAGREQVAAALGYRKSRVVRWQERWPAALAAVVALAALIAATAIWGVPAAAERIAAALPVAADATLGKSALRGLEAQHIVSGTRFSDQRVEQLRGYLNKVLPAHPRVPVRLLARDSSQLGPNALALPDGTIIITDEMVRAILGKDHDFDDEQAAMLMGVLAHEIGHIEKRHTARVMARTSLTAALSATLFGDFSAVAAGVPAVLMNMQYSREMELEADDYARNLLRQKGIPTEPLADLFDYLDGLPAAREQRALPRWMRQGLAYAASHPASNERAARLRQPAK